MPDSINLLQSYREEFCVYEEQAADAFPYDTDKGRDYGNY
jgi:hypothetical protein